ncbi:MAG: hypothetical protein FWE95_04130 [Planctomycetaceae bacterium]|nr:hypothetical protein [Planctomycetaceae bacterium]
MRILHRFCIPLVVLALLLTATKPPAQEAFAPLLTEDTVLFVHVDFSKVDVDLLKTEARTLGETILTALGFDDRSQRTTLRDLEVELEKLDEMIRPTLDTITKELGVYELAFIADESLPERRYQNEVPLIVAIPWKDKTDRHIETLLKALATPWWSGQVPAPEDTHFIHVGDFLLLVPMAVFDEKKLTAEWAKNAIADNSSPVLKVLQTLNQSDEIKAVVRIPKSLKKELQNVEQVYIPIEVFNLIRFGADKIEWIAASIPVSELLSGTEAKDWRVATVKMSSEADAKMLRELMVKAIDEGIFTLQLEAGDEMPPLAFEFFKGYLRTLLPDVEGDTSVFQWHGNLETMWRTWRSLDQAMMFMFLTRIPMLNEF